jgi:ABC-type multidrug transport system fused ATPase/permease subunit
MDEKNKDNKKRIDIEKVKGEIEFKDVWFRYPTRKEDFVMQGFSIKINPNENVALVGESGCGKSTFVNLLMRFYDIDSGEILLDGVNIKDYNLHDLRNVISLVMQEPTVFNYSILENLLYGKLNATNSEIYNATTVANANEFIEGTG